MRALYHCQRSWPLEAGFRIDSDIFKRIYTPAALLVACRCREICIITFAGFREGIVFTHRNSIGDWVDFNSCLDQLERMRVNKFRMSVSLLILQGAHLGCSSMTLSPLMQFFHDEPECCKPSRLVVFIANIHEYFFLNHFIASIGWAPSLSL